MSDKPVSDFVRQGWDVVGYAVSDMNGGSRQHNFLMRKAGAHKVVTVRKKMIGGGVVATEMDV